MSRKIREKIISETPAAKHWQRIGISRRQGIAVFLPGLRTNKSMGIGEYLDLIPLIDWCVEVGFNIIQLLPLNDNGNDISPYNAISAFALNPLFLSLYPYEPDLSHPSVGKLKRINRTKLLAYEKIRPLKEGLLRVYFEEGYKIIRRDSAYQLFIEENKHWLTPYLRFKTGRDKKQAHFYAFVQFLCHRQMTYVKTYAEEKGVLIKGDIPILVSPNSADVLAHQGMFNKKMSAGAPPDQYSNEGQNWGFPIYRWESRYEAIMRWWGERLAHASKYYHLYRLDHVVGLFRIWSIPSVCPAKEGFFVPSAKREWLPKGKKILKAFLKECPMLPIAEDLGCVPDAVRACLEGLGIPGTKVIRWEQGVDPKTYSPISMTTLSTHDVETVAEWWTKYPEDASSYAHGKGWRYRKMLSQQRLLEILQESYSSGSLFHINLLQEVLRLEPSLSWEDPHDDRINVPATVSRKNWRYKYRQPLEAIAASKALKRKITSLL